MIRYAIIEDNNYALKHLRMLVETLRPQWQNVFTGKGVTDTVHFLESGEELDLIFLDIELTDGGCFEIFESIETDVPIIFTTAYKDFAVKAFKLNSVGYVLKPVSSKELEEAISKFEYLYLRQKTASDTEETEPAKTAYDSIPASRILTVNGDRYDYIKVEDIVYFESEDSYVFAHIRGRRRRLIQHQSLTKLEELLPRDSFFRVSRNMIISIGSIKSVGKYLRGRLLVRIEGSDGDIDLTVAPTKRDAFLEWLGR